MGATTSKSSLVCIVASKFEVKVNPRAKLININGIFSRLINIAYIGSASYKAIVSALRQGINGHILILYLLTILEICLVTTPWILSWTIVLRLTAS